MSGIEGELQSADGTRLFWRRWAASGEARGAVAIIPGYADHSGRYGHVAELLVEAGMAVAAIDLRGHGKSDGRRGYVRRFDDYLNDAIALIDAARATAPGKPLFLLGHSMGGLVALQTAIHREPKIRGLIVSSPFLGVAMKVPAIKEALGRVMSLVCPILSLPSGIDPYNLSHDRAVGNAYAADPLVFKTANARWYTEALGAAEETLLRAGRIQGPCLVMQAGQDRLADPKKSRPLFEALGSLDKRHIVYPEMFHEIFNETDKQVPLGELRDWIAERA